MLPEVVQGEAQLPHLGGRRGGEEEGREEEVAMGVVMGMVMGPPSWGEVEEEGEELPHLTGDFLLEILKVNRLERHPLLLPLLLPPPLHPLPHGLSPPGHHRVLLGPRVFLLLLHGGEPHLGRGRRRGEEEEEGEVKGEGRRRVVSTGQDLAHRPIVTGVNHPIHPSIRDSPAPFS